MWLWLFFPFPPYTGIGSWQQSHLTELDLCVPENALLCSIVITRLVVKGDREHLQAKPAAEGEAKEGEEAPKPEGEAAPAEKEAAPAEGEAAPAAPAEEEAAPAEESWKVGSQLRSSQSHCHPVAVLPPARLYGAEYLLRFSCV